MAGLSNFQLMGLLVAPGIQEQGKQGKGKGASRGPCYRMWSYGDPLDIVFGTRGQVMTVLTLRCHCCLFCHCHLLQLGPDLACKEPRGPDSALGRWGLSLTPLEPLSRQGRVPNQTILTNICIGRMFTWTPHPVLDSSSLQSLNRVADESKYPCR